jgi:hypothetical protein
VDVSSFDELSKIMRVEFSKIYSDYDAGRISKADVSQFELEMTQWVMDLLTSTTDYDHAGIADREDRGDQAIYRLIIGNERSGNNRTHVCLTMSGGAVLLLASEFGMRKDAIRLHSVYEGFDGQVFPDVYGVGHAVAGLISLDAKC